MVNVSLLIEQAYNIVGDTIPHSDESAKRAYEISIELREPIMTMTIILIDECDD